MLALSGAGAALGRAMAQAPPVPPPANPDQPVDKLVKAREENRRGAENLAKFEVPMSTEPAFVFRP